MMIVLAGVATVDIDALLLQFISKRSVDDLFDPVEQLLEGSALVGYFLARSAKTLWLLL